MPETKRHLQLKDIALAWCRLRRRGIRKTSAKCREISHSGDSCTNERGSRHALLIRSRAALRYYGASP